VDKFAIIFYPQLIHKLYMTYPQLIHRVVIASLSNWYNCI